MCGTDSKPLLMTSPRLIEAQMQDTLHTRMPRTLHMHDDRVEILLIRRGEGIHIIGGQTYLTKAGDILIFDVNVLHDEYAVQNSGLEILSCSIGNLSLRGLSPNQLLPSGASPVLHDGWCRHEAEALMTMICAAGIEPQKISPEMLRHLLSSLVLLIHQAGVRSAQAVPTAEYEVGRAIQSYVDQHYLEDISIASISEAMRFGESYLSHAFKNATGYSIRQYIIRRRIGEAQSWLLMSGLSITDIALKVGYNSVSNFHNTFRRVVGMSPQQYRDYWKEI